MAKTVSFNANCNLSDSYLEDAAKWLSCNGEVWGMGPTALFAAAAALFLHHELQASLFGPGDHPNVTLLEHILVTAMVVGTLALMVHIWVCLMRFFQYYLDTLIRDSPNVLLEMTTAGLLGSSQPELAALGPLTRFLRQQQPQIHITLCWLLALCYADYIRKHYCTRFNMPYLEQWQGELHAMAERRARGALSAAHSFAAGVRLRLRGLAPPPPTNEAHTVSRRTRGRGMPSAGAAARRLEAAAEPARPRFARTTHQVQPSTPKTCRSLEHTSRPRGVRAAAGRVVHEHVQSHRYLRHLHPRLKCSQSASRVAADPTLQCPSHNLSSGDEAAYGNRSVSIAQTSTATPVPTSLATDTQLSARRTTLHCGVRGTLKRSLLFIINKFIRAGTRFVLNCQHFHRKTAPGFVTFRSGRRSGLLGCFWC